MAVHLIPTTKPADHLSLTVLLLAGDETPSTAQNLEQEASIWLHEHGLQANYRRLVKTDVPHLAQAVQVEHGGLLILATQKLPIQAEAIQALLNQIDCPILLIRSLKEG
jgi:hypothetical protein